jgi:hypothetical protein
MAGQAGKQYKDGTALRDHALYTVNSDGAIMTIPGLERLAE